MVQHIFDGIFGIGKSGTVSYKAEANEDGGYWLNRLREKFPALGVLSPTLDTLFAKGNTSLLTDKKIYVGIVGTRRSTVYGNKVAEMFASHIAKSGGCVVSGLAYGIDASAHRGALQKGGSTIGVSACGLDGIYPESNKNLFEHMARRGCIISEHGGVTDSQRFRFPLRNRIVAAISDLLLVVEAPEKSGALITAKMALDLGKTVAAVPGSIFSLSSVGSNKLIEDGAIPLCSTNQLDHLMEFIANSKIDMAAMESLDARSRKLISSIESRSEGYDGVSLSSFSSAALHYLRTHIQADIFEISAEIGASITDTMLVLEELRAEGIVKSVREDTYVYVV